ncbi:aminopeptidase [bacterium]|nr:aminopeptidase [bacterium]
MKKSTLKQYAKLIVNVGANVQKNQNVVISASVTDEYFVKYVVEECYKAKAKIVRVDWFSDEITKSTYKYAKTETLKEVPNWRVEKLKYDAEKLPASIYIDSSDPDALASVDQEKIMAVRKATSPIFKPIRDEMENKHQWTIAAIPSEKWAQKVFPNESKKNAVSKLWDAILKCARADIGDPVKNWELHNKTLLEKCTKLNSLNIDTLIYSSKNGTNFKVRLIEGLQFLGGGSYTISGVYYNPNMPTEECFISPNKMSAEGVVYASKPLSLNGKVVKDFGFKFHEGKIVEVYTKNEEDKKVFDQLINLDEGASRLGEVALVPYNSPINETGLLFNNTLFDENACCHLAIGVGFEDTIIGFEKMTKEEIKAFDINDSMIHVDFMIGTDDLSIKAITRDNKEVQIFENGTWAI